MCPYCRTHAPLVYRGLRATCAACGAPRMVLSGSSLTHAGKPSAVGGSVVKAVGWAALTVGLFFALIMGLILSLFSVTSGLILGGALALVTVVAFLLLRSGGKKLQDSGKEAQDTRREQALFALALNRGGKLQAMDASQALDLSVEEADAFLTELAKRRADVGVDIGENGEIFYTFTRSYGGGVEGPSPTDYGRPANWGVPPPRVRVDHPTDIWQPRTRVAAEVASAPTPRPPAPPEVVDVEMESIEEAERARRQHRR